MRIPPAHQQPNLHPFTRNALHHQVEASPLQGPAIAGVTVLFLAVAVTFYYLLMKFGLAPVMWRSGRSRSSYERCAREEDSTHDIWWPAISKNALPLPHKRKSKPAKPTPLLMDFDTSYPDPSSLPPLTARIDACHWPLHQSEDSSTRRIFGQTIPVV